MKQLLLVAYMSTLLMACSDDPGAPLYRRCPALPSQMEPDERVVIDIVTAEDRTIASTLTASVTAAGGFIETYESPSASIFTATVDRLGARIVCSSELVIRAAEPLPVSVTN